MTVNAPVIDAGKLVKPLVWADGGSGSYTITSRECSRCEDDVFTLYHGRTEIGRYHGASGEGLKDIAQADHAARILAAIDLTAQSAELDRLRTERRNIVSHATMGGTDGEGMSLNDVCVEITANRNDIYTSAKNMVDRLRTELATAIAERDAQSVAMGRVEAARVVISNLCDLINMTVYYTPEQFGAKGDGVTDDTAAITAAFKAMATYGQLMRQARAWLDGRSPQPDVLTQLNTQQLRERQAVALLVRADGMIPASQEAWRRDFNAWLDGKGGA